MICFWEFIPLEMHAIQTSGNCIRNVTTDQFAGAAADEIADPRPYAEILRQWSSVHPEFSFLPRKFKIAVTGAPHDRAAIQVHDIGLQLVKNKPWFPSPNKKITSTIKFLKKTNYRPGLLFLLLNRPIFREKNSQNDFLI